MSTSNIWVLDIETREDPYIWENPDHCATILEEIKPDKRLVDVEKIITNKQAKYESLKDRAALDPNYGCIKSFAIGGLDTDEIDSYCSNDEADLLSDIAQHLCELPSGTIRPTLAGHNIREFDIPFLALRCAVHDIELPSWWPNSRSEYYRVIDSVDIALSRHDRLKLSVLLRTLRIPPKSGSGKDSLTLPLDKLEEYNRDDVDRERRVIRRILPYIQRRRSA